LSLRVCLYRGTCSESRNRAVRGEMEKRYWYYPVFSLDTPTSLL
jgi:hypothetical protein